jgi:hypothetical protein
MKRFPQPPGAASPEGTPILLLHVEAKTNFSGRTRAAMELAATRQKQLAGKRDKTREKAFFPG